MMMNRRGRRPAGQPEPARTSLSVRRQAHTPGAEQTGKGSVGAPAGPAVRPQQTNVLMVGTAKSEVGGCGVIVRYRHKTENDPARVDLDDAAEAGQCGP